jgi:hypothetical protein
MLLLLATRPAARAETGWLSVGTASLDGGGSWRFEMTSAEDLISQGLTFMRVTSAACATEPDEAYVFEAKLKATDAGDKSWDGKLEPVGALARGLTGLDAASGDVHLTPSSSGTKIVGALDGLPPGMTLSVCVRQG